jgi:hypothetical protein
MQTVETLLNETCEILRCASATAYEAADALHGSQRDHAMSVVHLINLAQSRLDTAERGATAHA